MKKAVIFDLDGTLLDTVGDIRACLNGVLELFGYPSITLEQAQAYIGNGAKKLVCRAVPQGGDAEDVYEEFHTRYGTCDNSLTRLFAEERETLAFLQKRGLQLAVVTNKPQNATEHVLKQHLSEVSFAFVGGDSGAFPCKPDPSLTRYAMLKMRVSPEECVFVGDGETDVLTAKAAGIDHIACLWGYRSEEQLKAAGATRFVRRFRELQYIE